MHTENPTAQRQRVLLQHMHHFHAAATRMERLAEALRAVASGAVPLPLRNIARAAVAITALADATFTLCECVLEETASAPQLSGLQDKSATSRRQVDERLQCGVFVRPAERRSIRALLHDVSSGAGYVATANHYDDADAVAAAVIACATEAVISSSMMDIVPEDSAVDVELLT